MLERRRFILAELYSDLLAASKLNTGVGGKCLAHLFAECGAGVLANSAARRRNKINQMLRGQAPKPTAGYNDRFFETTGS